jgi:hypothetical protein
MHVSFPPVRAHVLAIVDARAVEPAVDPASPRLGDDHGFVGKVTGLPAGIASPRTAQGSYRIGFPRAEGDHAALILRGTLRLATASPYLLTSAGVPEYHPG